MNTEITETPVQEGQDFQTELDSFESIEDGQYIVLDRRIDGGKLSWLHMKLRQSDIPYRLNGLSIHGHVVEVAQGFLEDASAILNGVIGDIMVIPNGRVVWNDLDNNHPIFGEVLSFEMAEEAIKQDAPVGGGLVLPYTDLNLPKYESPIRMFDVDSSNVSSIGTIETGFMDKIPKEIVIFARFKGSGPFYRYYGPDVSMEVFNALIAEAKLKAMGHTEASVGSLWHQAIRIKADEGIIQCDKTDADGNWERVPPKKERVKKMKVAFAPSAEIQQAADEVFSGPIDAPPVIEVEAKDITPVEQIQGQETTTPAIVLEDDDF